MSDNSQYSFSKLSSFVSANFGLIALVLVLFGSGFYTGSLYKENKMLKENKVLAEQDEQPTAKKPAGPSQDQLKKLPKVTDNDHLRGAQDAKVTIIEYSDYECPFCNKFHPTMKKLMDEYGDQVAWVYRHFPLKAMHPNAQTAAEVSECLAKYEGDQAFWEFSDILYERIQTDNTVTQPENLMAIVEEMDANVNQIQTCLDEGEMTDKVDQQAAGGKTAGVNGTPGSVIVTEDGQYELIPGAYPFDTLKEKIDGYLE